MADREARVQLYESSMDFDELPLPSRGTPGKATVTSRMMPAPVTNVIFRVANADAANALAESFSSSTSRQLVRRDSNGVAPDADEAVARADASSGQPLPAPIREKFESSLGADLGAVRIHTGSESAPAAKALGARAYTVGQDIHFAEGEYGGTDPFSMHLLAHEVAHTVQQQGAAPTRQHKLEVSAPADAAELEADRAADLMVAGLPAQISAAKGSLFRKTSSEIKQYGDSAEGAARGANLSVDTASVTVDRSRVGELRAEIRAQKPLLEQANKADTFDTVSGDPLMAIGVNAATDAALEIFDDSLQMSNVDTKAFAVQFRVANADFQRLQAEAQQLAGEKMSGAEMKLDTGMAEFNSFKAARQNLNSAATNMEGKLTKARGAASSLQGALYAVRAKAAQAKADAAKSKLAAIQAEIAAAAAAVGKIVKLAGAVAGLAGGGGATSALAGGTPDVSNTTIEKSPLNLFENPTPGHYELNDTEVTPLPVGSETELSSGRKAQMMARAQLIGAMGKDGAGLAGLDAAGIAEKLVTAVGEYAEKNKIKDLQAKIAAEEAINETFKAASEAANMFGFVETMKGAAKDLDTQVKAFQGARTEMTRARDALMAKLEKQGTKGKNQAKGVLFVSDADKFLAQAKNAIAVGKHQQTNLKEAAEKRKSLRGTAAPLEGKDRANQTYYKCHKTSAEGTLWGTNNYYRLTRVFVTLGGTGDMENPNELVQGGQGSVEGVGGAGDVIARDLKTLEENEKKVTIMRARVQDALFGAGQGDPGLNG